MKWCTTGGPVLHLGRCCGTPLKLGGNLLEEVEDAGMRRLLLLLLTRHRVTQGANPVMLWRKKRKEKPTPLLQYDIYVAFRRAVCPLNTHV